MRKPVRCFAAILVLSAQVACDDDEGELSSRQPEVGRSEVEKDAGADPNDSRADGDMLDDESGDAGEFGDARDASGVWGAGDATVGDGIVQARGTLEALVGVVGIGRPRDGIGRAARWAEISAVAFDPARRRFYVLDESSNNVTSLRRLDLATAEVSTVNSTLSDLFTSDLFTDAFVFQRDALYALAWRPALGVAREVVKLSPTDGSVVARHALPNGRQARCLAAGADGNRLYIGRSDDDPLLGPPVLQEFDPASGATVDLALAGYTFGQHIEACTMAPDGRLLAWTRRSFFSAGSHTGTNATDLVRIDLDARRSDLVRSFADHEFPYLTSYLALDPGGEFVGGNLSLYRFGPTGPAVLQPERAMFYGMVRDGQDLYIGRGKVFDKRLGAGGLTEVVAGEPHVPTSFNQPGPGARTRLFAARMAVGGGELYLASGPGYLKDNPNLGVDLETGNVREVVPESDPGSSALAVAVAPDGSVYFAGQQRLSSDCTVSRLLPGAGRTTRVFTSRMPCPTDVRRTSRDETHLGLAHAAGHLYLVQENLDFIQDIDLATGMARDLPATEPITQPIDVVAGADGNLYVLAQNKIYRVHPRIGGATVLIDEVFSPCLTADAAGHLFAGGGTRVISIDLATGSVTTVVGGLGLLDVRTGPLPGALRDADALAAGPSGDLLILDRSDSVLLRARF
jgi:hypothetical protein